MLWCLLAACTAAEADEVAEIMWTTGDVTLHQDGNVRAGIAETALARDARLVTGEDGVAILLLANNHLVRIESDLELAVDDLVMLGAPPATASIQSQFSKLIYPDEHATVSSADWERAQRVAGWQARRSAATSLTGAQDAPTNTEAPADSRDLIGSIENEVKEEAVQRPDGQASDKRRPAPPKTATGGPPRSPSPPPPPAVGETVPSTDERDESTTAKSPGAPGRTVGGGAGGGAPASTPAAPIRLDALATTFDTGGSRTCLVDWRDQLGVPLASVTIQLHLDDGIVRRASGKGGLRLPPCALQQLEGRAVEVKKRQRDAVVPFEVSLE